MEDNYHILHVICVSCRSAVDGDSSLFLYSYLELTAREYMNEIVRKSLGIVFFFHEIHSAFSLRFHLVALCCDQTHNPVPFYILYHNDVKIIAHTHITSSARPEVNGYDFYTMDTYGIAILNYIQIF